MSTLVARISTTITSGQSVSSTVKLDGHVPSILEMSAAWDVAALFFQASSDDSNFYTLYDEDGLALVAAAGATRRITLPSAYLANHKSIKIGSGTPTTPVNQTADRVLYVEIWE